MSYIVLWVVLLQYPNSSLEADRQLRSG